MKIQNMYMNAAVSAENGLEAYTLHYNHLNQQDFCEIVDLISKKGNNWSGYLDNATIGRS
jgi:hypothetical protein